jgi:glycosyltransferase 2 family protein
MVIPKRLQIIFLLLLGIVLIYFSISKINLKELVETIQHGHFWMAIPVFCVSLFGYYVRSLRWKLLLDSIQVKTNTSDLFAALSIGYAVNIATPRLGEVARCLMLKKSSAIPLEQSGVSVVVERVIDIVSLVLIMLVASMLQVNASADFIQQQIILPLTDSLFNVSGLWWLIIAIGIGLVLMLFRLVWYRWVHSNVFIQRAWKALTNIAHLQSKFRFFVYTVTIWLCYFLMTYLWFGIFDETKHLGLGAAFVLMAVGSIGRSVPIQGGGMGAYHFLVSHAFGLFGVGLLVGNAMAFVIHGAQIVFTFVLGIVCWLWIVFKTDKE